MLNRLTENCDALVSLNLTGCYQLFVDPRLCETERTVYWRQNGWDHRNDFCYPLAKETDYSEDDDDDDDDVARDRSQKNKSDNVLSRHHELKIRIRDHRASIRELASHLKNLTSLNLSGTPIIVCMDSPVFGRSLVWIRLLYCRSDGVVRVAPSELSQSHRTQHLWMDAAQGPLPLHFR